MLACALAFVALGRPAVGIEGEAPPPAWLTRQPASMTQPPADVRNYPSRLARLAANTEPMLHWKFKQARRCAVRVRTPEGIPWPTPNRTKRFELLTGGFSRRKAICARTSPKPKTASARSRVRRRTFS